MGQTTCPERSMQKRLPDPIAGQEGGSDQQRQAVSVKGRRSGWAVTEATPTKD